MSATNQSSLGPGKAWRKGITIFDLMDMFPDEEAAERWFVETRWPDGIRCPRCESWDVARSTHPDMPYRCRFCRRHFSAKVGTVMQSSKIGYRQWAFAIYMFTTNLKGTSSMHLYRELGISQNHAWHMGHRLRKLWEQADEECFDGPVEFDEAFFGGLEKNKHWDKRLRGNWRSGKTAVAGARDHMSGQISASVVEDTTPEIIRDFVIRRAHSGTESFTDDNKAYKGLELRRFVRHSVGQFVNDQATTNGMESFWAMMKRGYMGVYHRMSPAHLQRYVDEFVGRHNMRRLDTELQMIMMVQLMVGKRLRYKDLAVGKHEGRVRVAE
jgi:transposase-like protein